MLAGHTALLSSARYSPDGRTLVYRTGTIGSSDLWYRALQGDTTPKPIANTPFTEWAPRLSPDGHWVAYTSDESGTFQVYVRPFPGPGGARTQVSADGGDIPVWSRDGHRLFYVRSQKMMVATLATSPAFTVTTRRELFESDYTYLAGHSTYDVSPNGEQIVVLKPVGGDAQTVVAYNWKAELRATTGAKAPR